VAINGLIALYQLNPSFVSLTIVPKLWIGSENGRLVAVKACTRLLTFGRHLAWHPPISIMRAEVVNSIRNTLKVRLKQYVRLHQSTVIAIVGDRTGTSRSKASSEALVAQIELATEILLLYQLDPSFSWTVNTGSSQSEPLSTALTAIISLIVGSSPESVRQQATETLIAILHYLGSQAVNEQALVSQIASSASTM
jgi:neurofibromin 1